MLWLNQPSDKSSIKIESNSLSFECDIETDFWITQDLNRHSGHFYHMDSVKGDFTAYVEIAAHYNTIYDQCGLMIIKDKNNWIKTGIEFVECQHVSCVVTKALSDWSVSRIEQNPKSIEIKITRIKAKIIIQFRLPGKNIWYLLRKFEFSADALQVGLMACSPQRKDENHKFLPNFRNFCLNQSKNLTDPIPD